MFYAAISSRRTTTPHVKLKDSLLTVIPVQPHRSRWNGERFKPYLLIFAFVLLAAGRLLLSQLHRSNSEQLTYAESDAPFETLDASTNVSPKFIDGTFLGASELVDLPFFDGGSMAAIIAVTASSLEQVHQLIENLLSDESSVSAITVVCPAQAIPDLHAKLLGGHVDIFVDIHITLWPDGFDEGSVILNAAAQVQTEYALVIGSRGLGGLSEESREQLLSDPLLLDVPSGVCGGNFTKAGDPAICAVPGSSPRPASFLFPPFVIPTYLIRDFNSSASDDVHFWMNLGRALSLVNDAGAVIRESDRKSDWDWCRAICMESESVSANSPLDQCFASSTKDDDSDETRNPSLSSSLAIILRTMDDLETFSSVVCRFFENSYSTHVLILSHELEHSGSHDSSFPWLHDHLISSVCNISYSALHGSASTFANAEAVAFWLESANETMSIVIYGSGKPDDASEYPLAAALEKQATLGVTVIKIPQGDIPYCDWIGSLSLHELRNWHLPETEISVITDNRPSSLKRLFKSLEDARYFGDAVPIRINVEQTADLETRRLVDDFRWDHGAVFVHHRVIHAGLLSAVVESWYPRSNHSYGILLEDDVEVSVLFYAWIKMSLLRYRYGSPPNRQSSLFGISLYQQKHIELRPEGRRPFDARVLFDIWGAVYFPEHWREFHAYLTVRFSEAWLPLRDHVVPHVRSNRWAKSWKRFFIELVFLRGYVMLYPNYDDFVSLSTNHLEIGSHVKEQPRRIYEQKKAMFTLPLMTVPDLSAPSDDSHATGLLDLPEQQLPSWTDLPILDLLGGLASEVKLEERGNARQKELVGCATIGSQDERRRPFEAEELFTCSVSAEEESETEEELAGGIHY